MVNCSILGCKSRSERKESNITFHSFPADLTLRNVWIRAAGRTDWQPTKYSRICSKHFERHRFRVTNCRTILTEGSVPKQFLPTFLETASSLPQSTELPSNSTHAFSEMTSSVADSRQQCMDVVDVTLSLPSASSNSRNVAPNPVDVTPRKKKLVKKLREKTKQLAALRSKNWRLQKKNAELTSVIEDLKTRFLINQETADILYAVNPGNKDILKRLVGGSTEKKYSPELRKFALSLHFISPRAYDFVRKTFDTCLPHPRTLTRWYQSIDGEPGFSKESLEALKLLSKNSEKQLYGALCFDEMAIRKCVEWDGNNYVGFVNCGNNVDCDVSPIAKEALVFMLTCVNGSWKIPVGYFNINGISAEQKAMLVRQCLDLVEECGVNVISVTFDGCPANFSMARVLGCKLDEQELDPTFSHNGKEVVIFPDPSHMLKLIRNSLGDKKTITTQDCKIISWEYVQKIVDIQENEGFHLGNNLTKSHINFRKQVMKVRLAAQVLSESVADALEVCRDELHLEDFADCGSTVEFIRNFNSLFDIMNSRNLRAFGYKRPLSERNIETHRNFLNYMYNYIKLLQLENFCVLDCKRKTGYLGFMICIKSLLVLYDKYVETNKLTFLSSYKLSQDHLECFFSAIRARGGFNNNPTARQFQSAFKRMLIHGELKHITIGKCVALEDIHILTCTQPEVALNNSTRGNRSIDIDKGEMSVSDSMIISREHDYLADPTMLTEFSKQVIIYIAGFVIRHMEAQIKCHNCLSALVSSTPYKSLQMKKDKGGLHYPTKDVIAICEVAETTYRKTKTFGQKNPLHNLLQECMKKCLNLNLFSELSDHFAEQSIIDSHYPLLIKCICKKYLNTRIHHASKKIVDSGEKVRNFYTKLVLFKGQ